jgi:hypothetical protein
LRIRDLRYLVAKGSFFDEILAVPSIEALVQLAQPRREAVGEFQRNPFRHRGAIGANDIIGVAAAAFHPRRDRRNGAGQRALIGVIAVAPISLFARHRRLERGRFEPERAENVPQDQHHVQRFGVGKTFGEADAAAMRLGPVNIVVVTRDQMDSAARWPMLRDEFPQVEILLAIHMGEDDRATNGWVSSHALEDGLERLLRVGSFPSFLDRHGASLLARHRRDDPSIKERASWTRIPEGDKTSSFTVYGYVIAQTIVQVLKQCGDELTRENFMRQAANLKGFELGLLLPGIKINTSSNDISPLSRCRCQSSTVNTVNCFGLVISGEIKKE